MNNEHAMFTLIPFPGFQRLIIIIRIDYSKGKRTFKGKVTTTTTGDLLLLEHENAIRFNIRKVNSFPLDSNQLMLPHKEPSNMGKEESSLGIMWISMCFGIFMMHAMVSYPFPN